MITLVRVKGREDVIVNLPKDSSASDHGLLWIYIYICVFKLFVPFIVKLQSVLAIQRGYKLSDHSLGLLPLVPPQHPDMGHQPGHRTDCHTANLSLDVISDLLHSERDDGSKKKKKEGRLWLEGCGSLSKKSGFWLKLQSFTLRCNMKTWMEKGKNEKLATPYMLQVLYTLLSVIFHRIHHAHSSNESNYKSRVEKILRHAMVREVTGTAWGSHEQLTEISSEYFQSQEKNVKKTSKNIKVGQTCTASTERTPFSHAFRTSKMAAGVLRQISCHFTWLSQQINVRGSSIFRASRGNSHHTKIIRMKIKMKPPQ